MLPDVRYSVLEKAPGDVEIGNNAMMQPSQGHTASNHHCI